MASLGVGELVAHVRRLAKNGAALYIQITAADIRRLNLKHGQRIGLDLAGISIQGIVKTSGGSCWLAPGESSNAKITAALRRAGCAHGDNVTAAVRILGSMSSREIHDFGGLDGSRAAARPKSALTALRFDSATAVRAVNAYNADCYRGRSNLEIDRTAYERFLLGLPRKRLELVDLVRFVGEDYGGAQRRFLPHGYFEEAALLVARLHPVLDQYLATVAAASPLEDRAPSLEMLTSLLMPFHGSKRWPVWASKTLHFLRPDVFPILDSRAKVALGLRISGARLRTIFVSVLCSATR